MLTFEEKLAVIESFPELERKNVSLGRVNFHYEESALDKKNVVYHLHPNGNGFVFAEYVQGYSPDSKGMVNIRDFTESELRDIISKSIQSLSGHNAEEAQPAERLEETWNSPSGETLVLIEEDEMWNIYAGLNLDAAFLSYREAKEYLEEEGFKRS
ncbi:hypothetical protein ACQCVH_17790 [Bacillus infantis]|uniref:hypothetical protein n=1 Tax=Bacillus infantis TaxID=324767 RepID=UPI003CED6586